MNREENIKKLQELRAELKAKKTTLMKGELKDTSSMKKLKKEIANILTKLNEVKNGS